MKSVIKSKIGLKGEGDDWAKMVRLRNEHTGDEVMLDEVERITV